MAERLEAELEDAQGLLQALGHAERRRYERKGSDWALVRQMLAATVFFRIRVSAVTSTDPETITGGDTPPAKRGRKQVLILGAGSKDEVSLGDHFRPHFLKTVAALGAILASGLSLKVTASWHWFNWSLQISEGKTPLLLNIDETACSLFYDDADGVLAGELIALAAGRGVLAQNARRGETRSNLSLLALIC